MSRITAIYNVIVASLLVALLWIECENTRYVPDFRDVVIGLGLIAAPCTWLSLLAYVTRRHPWPAGLTMGASLLVGAVAVWILSNNTIYTPLAPGEDYRNPAPPIVLVGQVIFTAIVTPVILLSYVLSVVRSPPVTCSDKPTSVHDGA